MTGSEMSAEQQRSKVTNNSTSDGMSHDTSVQHPRKDGEPVHVALFVTCLVDIYRPNVGFASIRLLEDAGCKVSVPPAQTCCGQPAFNSGETKNARDIARNTIKALAGFEYVVVPSGSCAGMLKHHYPELLADEPDAGSATELASRVFELTEFLTEVVGASSADITPSSAPPVQADEISVTYHDGCSGLREMGIREQPRELLSRVDGLTLHEMEDTEVCCGFGGTFCVKYPEISERLVTDKVALANQTGARLLLAGDLGCLLNMAGRIKRLNLPIRSYHVAEVLAGMADGPAIGEPATGESASSAPTGKEDD